MGNYALDFDGDNDYVSIPDDPSLRITGVITIEGWIYYHSGTYWMFISKGYLNEFEVYGYIAGNVVRWFRAGSFRELSFVTPVNEWFYIAIVDDGVNVIAYKNGAQVGSLGSLTGSSSTSTVDIGARPVGTSPFNGLIDEVRISDTARTPEEILANWNDGLGKRLEVDAHTVALWHLDENEGCIAYDETENDNDGTLMPDCPTDCPSWIAGKEFPADNITPVEISHVGARPATWLRPSISKHMVMT